MTRTTNTGTHRTILPASPTLTGTGMCGFAISMRTSRICIILTGIDR